MHMLHAVVLNEGDRTVTSLAISPPILSIPVSLHDARGKGICEPEEAGIPRCKGRDWSGGFEQDSSSHAIPDSSIIRHISRLIGNLSMCSAIARW